MHEVGIIREVLQAAEAAAQSAGCRTIHRVVLRVGAFSSAVPEALEFAFDALRAGTPAAEASLEIERMAGAAFCDRCQQEFAADEAICACPRCGEISGDLRRGFELDLLRVEAS